MTSFASRCGWTGVGFRLGYSGGSTVTMTSSEDCWSTDGQGSLRIGVGGGNYLYLSLHTSHNRCWRGACVHTNSWGQSEYNCDGDANQSCGQGLFGHCASNEIGSCASGSA